MRDSARKSAIGNQPPRLRSPWVHGPIERTAGAAPPPYLNRALEGSEGGARPQGEPWRAPGPAARLWVDALTRRLFRSPVSTTRRSGLLALLCVAWLVFGHAAFAAQYDPEEFEDAFKSSLAPVWGALAPLLEKHGDEDAARQVVVELAPSPPGWRLGSDPGFFFDTDNDHADEVNSWTFPGTVHKGVTYSTGVKLVEKEGWLVNMIAAWPINWSGFRSQGEIERHFGIAFTKVRFNAPVAEGWLGRTEFVTDIGETYAENNNALGVLTPTAQLAGTWGAGRVGVLVVNPGLGGDLRIVVLTYEAAFREISGDVFSTFGMGGQQLERYIPGWRERLRSRSLDPFQKQAAAEMDKAIAALRVRKSGDTEVVVEQSGSDGAGQSTEGSGTPSGGLGPLGVIGVIGTITALVLAAARKIAKNQKKTTTQKQEPENEDKDTPIGYVLQLSANRLEVASGRPQQLAVAVWKVDSTGTPSRDAEATVRLTLPKELPGLSVQPREGSCGVLRTTICSEKPLEPQTLTMRVEGVAKGGSCTAEVALEIAESFVLSIETESLPA